MKRKTTFERLRAKIEKDTDVKIYSICRTHCGCCQINSGAWSWVAKTNYGEIGSYWTATELLKCARVELKRHGYGTDACFEIEPIVNIIS